MDGNPEGTPNPLNPVQGVTPEVNEPEVLEPSTDTAAGTGDLDFIETEETSYEVDAPMGSIQEVRTAVDDYAAVKPASFAEPAAKPATISEPVRSAAPAPRPARPAHSIVDPMMRPVSRPSVAAATPAAPAVPEAPVAPATPEAPAAPATPAPTTTRAENNFDTFSMEEGSADTLDQNIRQITGDNLVASDSIVESKPKNGGKKKALIIGAIVFIMLAIICGAAAIAIVVVKNTDRVGMAIDKLLNGQMSSIVELKGTIDSTSESAADDAPESSSTMTANFDGTFDTVSLMNKVDATLTSKTSTGAEIALDIEEITNKSGDTYFKISGLDSLLKTLTSPTLSTESSLTTDSNTSFISAVTTLYTNLVNQIEDQWVLASSDTTNVAESASVVDNTTICAVSALSNLQKYGSDLAAKYRANSFISATKDGLGIAKKKNELYKLNFDKTKMNAFVKSAGTNGFVTALNECASNNNEDEDAETSSTLFEEIFANLPTIYVEVDDKDNFTRVYFTSTVEASGVSTSTKADIDISYPNALQIVEPEEYKNFSTVFSEVFSGFVIL